MRHLTVQQISGSLDGALSGVSLELVVRHLSSCRECRERHARLTKQDDALRRLLDCEFPEVFFDDMFARLGVVLEAESRGQMPPEHALPPELPPLSPEAPPSRETARPPSAAFRVPALLSDEEQHRRTAEELKAAEAAALNSLEELMRELRAQQETANEPAAAPEPPAAGPEPPATAPPPAAAMPASLLALPPEILSALREAGEMEPFASSAPAPPPAARTPEPAPPPAPQEQEAAPVAAQPAESLGIEPLGASLPAESESEQPFDAPPHEEPALQWTVVEGSLPVGPDFTPAPEPEFVAAPPPEPAPPAPEPEPVVPLVVELEPIHVPAPEPAPVSRAEPGRVVVAEPPRPRIAPTPNPVDDPFADYEDRLQGPPAGHGRYVPPARRVRKRHVAGAAVAVAALLVVLGASGYLPPVIRVPLPVLPPPRLPRVEVVKVPIAQPRRESAAPPVATLPARPGPEASPRAALSPAATSAPPSLVRPPAGETRDRSAGATARTRPPVTTTAPPRTTAPSRTSPPVASAPARTSAPAAAAPPPAAEAPALANPSPSPGSAEAATSAPAPAARTEPAPAASPAPAAGHSTEPEVDANASWPLLCGAVVDESGNPVAGARIALADLDLGTRTDRRGRFCMAAPPGDRTLSVVAAGFATHRRIVSLGADGLDLSIALAPAP